MFASDPVSVRQLRNAQLIEAEQHRRSHPAHERPRRAGRGLLARFRQPRTTVLDGSLELFVGLDRRTLDRLARHFIVFDLQAGDTLGRQGETASEFTVVLEGRIGVSLDGLPLAVLEPGTQFGALPLLDGGPGRFTRASFDVLEPTRVAVADRIQFAEIMNSFPMLAQRIAGIAEVRRAYLDGHADAKALAADHDTNPFPVHITDRV